MNSAVPAITSDSATVQTYERMVTAIAECERVDEAKDIRDKAVALEVYFRQAKNLEAERQAANVRLRAERRAGELMKELARAVAREKTPKRAPDAFRRYDGSH